MAVRTTLLFAFRAGPLIGALLARRGIDAAPILREHGLPDETTRAEITAPLGRIVAFVDASAAALGTTTFGLELADVLPQGSFGTVEFLMRTAPNFEHSMRVLCEFGALINPNFTFRFFVEGDRGVFRFTVASQRDTLGMHLNECTIWLIMRQFALQLGEPMRVESAWFTHARAIGAEDVARRLGCPVRFQAADCGFEVGRGVLDTPNKLADPAMHAFLLEQARSQLASSGEANIITQLVRALEPRLADPDLSTAEVARAMGLTQRSLQRHLTDAGTTYREVLQHVRHRRRAELLGGGLDDDAIAPKLGFPDVRAMRRSLDS